MLTPLHLVPLVLMLLLFPVILVDFTLFSQQLIAQQVTCRALAGGFGLASLFLVIMILAQVFTTVYDYIPVVGPFFRDKFWLVYFTAGIVLALPLLLVSKGGSESRRSRAFPGMITVIAAAAIASAFLTSPRLAPPRGEKTTLRVLTYNIQQGYSAYMLTNYDGQLDLIRGVDADIIGLQESDTNRIAGGNSDVVRYFAHKLNLYSYYGPKVLAGTFGVALLSKYPIENPSTFYLYSAGEQAAVIAAEITTGGKTFNVFVTHLGNRGPIVQQAELVGELRHKANVIAMGDFNFRSDTDQNRLTTAVLADAWLLKWPQGVNDQGMDASHMIDHIFVSPGTMVTDAQYLIGPQSDHPAMMAEIEWQGPK
jgi:endonuclease/exonuclease/phosphatase family metal-dependent hydrolase